MLETDPSFRPVRVRDGYPPLEDLGLIGHPRMVATATAMAERLSAGEFIDNFPQAFSHIGIIASGVTLARALVARDGQAGTAGAWA